MLKPSAFNAQVEHEGTHLAFNSVVACSLEMNAAQARLFNDALDEIGRSGSCEDESLLRCLYALGFVVPADYDELAAQQAAFQAAKTMRPEIERGIVEFVRRKSEDSKALVVQWFGGEPLLRFKRIVAMTEAFQRICADRNMRYHAEMLTNGVLLTPEIIASLPKLAVRAIQIPLDGDVETYARRKGITLERAKAYHEFLVEYMQSL